jgi:hypothetical protein
VAPLLALAQSQAGGGRVDQLPSGRNRSAGRTDGQGAAFPQIVEQRAQ